MSKRIIYMGSPAFAVPALMALVQSGHTIAAVFTQPDMPAGRGRLLTPPPVKLAATELGLPMVQARSLKDTGVQEQIARLTPDLIVVVAYAALLPTAVLKIPPAAASISTPRCCRAIAAVPPYTGPLSMASQKLV